MVERKNRILLEITRAIMIEYHVPIAFATYLTNHLPTKALNYKTPLATLGSHVLSSSHSLPPHVFGCVLYVYLPKRTRNKLEPRAVKGVFVGYGDNQKG